MNRFGLEYQPFRSLRKATMVASVLEPRHCLIIYIMTYNVIPKKTGHREIRKSDICFLYYMFHNQEFFYTRIPLPNIIISYIRSTVRRRTTSFKLAFPRLLSLAFEHQDVNLQCTTHEFVTPTNELLVSSFRRMSIGKENIPQPTRERKQKAHHD